MAEETQKNGAKIKIQYYHSAIGYNKKQMLSVKNIGLTKLNQIVERVDSPQMRGVVAKFPHLLRIVE